MVQSPNQILYLSVTEIYFLLLCLMCESVKQANSVMSLLFLLITHSQAQTVSEIEMTPYLHLHINMDADRIFLPLQKRQCEHSMSVLSNASHYYLLSGCSGCLTPP